VAKGDEPGAGGQYRGYAERGRGMLSRRRSWSAARRTGVFDAGIYERVGQSTAARGGWSGEADEGEQAEEKYDRKEELKLNHPNRVGAAEKRRKWREKRRGVRLGPKR
jgi:hypothetical protein